MTTIQTINQNHLFRRAYRSGKSFVSPFVVVYIVKRRFGGLRLGITASKKIGGAVKRNRARRVVRAAAFALLKSTRLPYDIVLVCRSTTADQKSSYLEQILKKMLTQAGILT